MCHTDNEKKRKKGKTEITGGKEQENQELIRTIGENIFSSPLEYCKWTHQKTAMKKN